VEDDEEEDEEEELLDSESDSVDTAAAGAPLVAVEAGSPSAGAATDAWAAVEAGVDMEVRSLVRLETTATHAGQNQCG
jgi:hypothetical protein